MTKEFENFKNELNSVNQTEERNRILEIENFKNQIIHDRKILKESGVIELFQDIRDSQIVSSQETIKEPVYKKNFFGNSRNVDYYEKKIIKKPAKIVLTDYENNYDYSDCLNPRRENRICISLVFNESKSYNDYGSEDGVYFNFIKVIVQDDCLNLYIKSGDCFKPNILSPIKTGELEKKIAWAIKNPNRPLCASSSSDYYLW